MTSIPETIPDDIKEAAWALANEWKMDLAIERGLPLLAKQVAAALLAERRAQIERDAKLIDCDCANYCDLSEAADKIRAQLK